MDGLTIFNFEPLVDEPKDNKIIRSVWMEDLGKKTTNVRTFQWAIEHFGKDPLGHVAEESSGRSTPSSSSDSGFSEEEDSSSASDDRKAFCKKPNLPVAAPPVNNPSLLLNMQISAETKKPSTAPTPSSSRPIPYLPPDLPQIPTEEDMMQMAIAAEDPAFWEAYYEGMEFYPKWYGRFNVHF